VAVIDRSDMSSEEFLRGPFLDFVKTLPGSPVSVVVRLMIAEGHKFPDLLQFYWDNVVSRGLGAIREILERGVGAGEFRRCDVTELPHLFVMPVVFSMFFRMLFDAPSAETDRIIETQLDVLIAHMQGAPS
jgi:hypothetical protein